ncbi:MAG: type II toxin-antitoxin system VapC family toxin [Desulfatiglandales bacterium]
MSKIVVIDASLAAMWALPEVHSNQALALANQWAQEDTRLIAPCLMLTEITNAFYKRVVRREVDLATGIAALHVVLEFGIEIREEPGLHSRAMELSHQLKRPATYDCHYLALAELHNCELWTGDERFYNSVKETMNQVKWIGNYVSPSRG